tara:strand:- start:4638 stop:5630 length:993 start_codon:yes stop_codon:yes gene_type:complete
MLPNPLTNVETEFYDGGVLYQGQIFQQVELELDEIRFMPADQRALRDQNGLPLSINSNRLLFLPVGYETGERNRNIDDDLAFKSKLERTPEILIDTTIPDELIFGMDFYSGIAIHADDYGRKYLIWRAGDVKCQKALPYLREIMMHDDNFEVRELAIESLAQLKGPEVASALCDKLTDTDDEMTITREKAAIALFDHPYPDNVIPLRDTFEEFSGDNYNLCHGYSQGFEAYEGGNIANYCLQALGEIPTLEALDGIKIGLSNPDYGIIENARRGLQAWIEKNNTLMIHGRTPVNQIERKKLIKNLILEHGVRGELSMADEKTYIKYVESL